jgi:uncharacterized protein (DUF58 family)
VRSATGTILLSTSFIFLLLGLFFRNWQLISMIIPVVMLVLLGALLYRPPEVALKVTREVDVERAMEGDVVSVNLTIENMGPALDSLQVRDTVPQDAEIVEGRNQFPLLMAAGQTSTINYLLKFPVRGNYVLGPVHAGWEDPLGMLGRSRTFEVSTRVTVLPRIQNLKKVGLRPSRVRTHVGNIPSKLLGPGTEFYCIRDYAPGDELRRINWKASSRLDRIVTNSCESDRSGDIIVVLDARRDIDNGRRVGSIIGREVEAAASLASHFLKERNRVGMIIVGDIIEVVPLGYGRRQFYRIVDRLLNVRPGENRSPLAINMAMRRYFPSSSMVIMVTPLDDKQIVGTIGGLAGRGVQVVTVTPSSIELEVKAIAEMATQIDPAGLAARLTALKRQDIIQELQRYGRVIDWNPDEPLSQYLMEVRGSHRT